MAFMHWITFLYSFKLMLFMNHCFHFVLLSISIFGVWFSVAFFNFYILMNHSMIIYSHNMQNKPNNMPVYICQRNSAFSWQYSIIKSLFFRSIWIFVCVLSVASEFKLFFCHNLRAYYAFNISFHISILKLIVSYVRCEKIKTNEFSAIYFLSKTNQKIVIV